MNVVLNKIRKKKPKPINLRRSLWSRQLIRNLKNPRICSKNRSMFRSRKAMIQSFTNAHAPNSNAKKLIWLDTATT